YISYSKRDKSRTEEFACKVGGDRGSAVEPGDPGDLEFLRGAAAPEVTSGSQLRTYRLAVSATNEYATRVGANATAATLAAQVLIVNRVNAVFERDLAIHMNLVANNDLITYSADNMTCGTPAAACTSANDPFTNDNGSTMLGQNQTAIDAAIGAANYDIGHVFSTAGGGVANLAVTCGSSKARGVTGLPNPVGDPFAIDFVAHEIGHQFGANHTFNGTSNGCGGNRSSSSAYEPGSGVTVMGYAGLCGSQNLAGNSIDTFHIRSIEAITQFSQSGSGNTCAVVTPTGNTPPAVSGPGNFTIPKFTPFSLTAAATDADGDSITYDWQQYDLGSSTATVPNSDEDGNARPIFRPFSPSASGTRTFPRLAHILNSRNVPPNTTGGFLTGEVLPSVGRTMNFQVIARDNRSGAGGVSTATSTVTVDGNSGPFGVTSPNAAATYSGNSAQNITWSVNGTNGAPINASSVKISMSTDGGNTFPIVLAANTPNDGTQILRLPIGDTTRARIKVEAVGNIFFDVSDVDFNIAGLASPSEARADFDGDGRSDLSVYRPSQGIWYQNRSTEGFSARQWGISSDVLVPGDYDGDNKTDFAVFRGTDADGPDFFVLNSATNTVTYTAWGVGTDVPVGGDYDGDGKFDYALWRPSNATFFIQKSTGGNFIQAQLGLPTDTPLTGDFDGDGKSDIGYYRTSNGTWRIVPSAGGPDLSTPLGEQGDMPVPADYNGDNVDDLAVFRPSTGEWLIIDTVASQLLRIQFGQNGDVPVPGDYDGDGREDIAVYRAGVWYLNQSSSGFFALQFGIATDRPIAKEYLP
ncbi:MAG TPA: zinc-dependent metalloprotease family protein, partial [Pyrinomonadaceae bacterium]|nr:zinc-dependent metalloprotease family protein [Pyrinomonadaceae bacterium]